MEWNLLVLLNGRVEIEISTKIKLQAMKFHRHVLIYNLQLFVLQTRYTNAQSLNCGQSEMFLNHVSTDSTDCLLIVACGYRAFCLIFTPHAPGGWLVSFLTFLWHCQGPLVPFNDCIASDYDLSIIIIIIIDKQIYAVTFNIALKCTHFVLT